MAGAKGRAKPVARPRRQAASRRVEKVEATRQRLFDAALKVVGESGYAGSSIAKIAARAEVAQGTFYSYFASQQDVFDQLLPYLGNRLLNDLREKLRGCEDPYEREAIGFRAYFDFLSDNPEFERILSEAAVFTPQGFHDHVQNIVSGYMRAFRHSRARGELPHYSERELEAVTYILLGARAYLSQRFMAGGNGRGGAQRLPDWVVTAYMKFMRYGLTGPRRVRQPSGQVDPSDHADDPAPARPQVVQRGRGRAIVRASYDPADGAPLALLAQMAIVASAAALPPTADEQAVGSFTYNILDRPAAGEVYALAEAAAAGAGLASVSVRFHEGRPDGRALGTALLAQAAPPAS